MADNEINWQETFFRVRYAMENLGESLRRYTATWTAALREETERRRVAVRALSELREADYVEWKARREADHA